MSLQINPQLIQAALDKAKQELPPLPTVMVRVLELTESSDSGSVAEVEQLIKSDQAISSKLLRIVNSAYFGLSGQVSSVSQAVVILGFQQVRNLVLSISMMSSFDVSQKGKEAQMRLWESAFATASAAQLIGRKKKIDLKEQELVFVGGLLQNIGALFMLSALTRPYIQILDEVQELGSRLSDVERARLGTDHAEVGAELLRKWKLPENLVELIEQHEKPVQNMENPALCVVQVAERLGDLVTHGRPLSMEELGLPEDLEAWLGFTEADYEWLLDEVKVKVSAALDLIGNIKTAA